MENTEDTNTYTVHVRHAREEWKTKATDLTYDSAMDLYAEMIKYHPTPDVMLSDKLPHHVLYGTDTHKYRAHFDIVSKTQKMSDYLYYMEYDTIDDVFATKYFDDNYRNFPKRTKNTKKTFCCTAFRSGMYIGRNLDWSYDENVDVVVKVKGCNKRLTSIGVASCIKGLTKDTVDNASEDTLKLIPYHIVDGINECSVYCSINALSVGDHGVTRGTNIGVETSVCVTALPRYILDNAHSAEEAIKLLNDINIYGCYTSTVKEEAHLFISDKKDTFVVEFMPTEDFIPGTKTYQNCDTQMVVHKVFGEDAEDLIPCITNFPLHNLQFKDGEIDLEELNEVSPYGQGLERYDNVRKNLELLSDIPTIMEFLVRTDKTASTNNVTFTTLYTNDIEGVPAWKSEFCGTELSSGKIITIKDLYDDSEFTEDDWKELFSKVHEKYLEDVRDGSLWQTVHSAVYGLEFRGLVLKTQEDPEHVYKFSI